SRHGPEPIGLSQNVGRDFGGATHEKRVRARERLTQLAAGEPRALDHFVTGLGEHAHRIGTELVRDPDLHVALSSALCATWAADPLRPVAPSVMAASSRARDTRTASSGPSARPMWPTRTILPLSESWPPVSTRWCMERTCFTTADGSTPSGGRSAVTESAGALENRR